MSVLEEGESLWKTVEGRPVRYFAAPTWYLAREAAGMRDVRRVEDLSPNLFNVREGREVMVRRKPQWKATGR